MDEIGIKQIADRWAKSTEVSMRAILRRNNKSNTRLYNLIKINVVETPEGGFRIETAIPNYAIFVDGGGTPWGRKPNSKPPPIRSIMDWMNRRNIQTGNDPNAPEVSNNKAGSRYMHAYFISKKIGKEGIKAIPFLYLLKRGRSNEVLSKLITDLEIRFTDYIKSQFKDNEKNINIQ